MARNEQKSYRKFSKISLRFLCTRGTVVTCALMLCFFLRRHVAPQLSVKFRTASFRHFCRSLRRDSVAIYGSIWTQFSTSVRALDFFFYNALIVS